MSESQSGKLRRAPISFKLSAFGSGFLDGFASMGRIFEPISGPKFVRIQLPPAKSDWQAVQDDFATVFPRMNEGPSR
jgi:hypothetical protein